MSSRYMSSAWIFCHAGSLTGKSYMKYVWPQSESRDGGQSMVVGADS
jgi:hypothetical protein